MVLNLGKGPGYYIITERYDGYKEVVIKYEYQEYSYQTLSHFKFMKPAISRLFYMAYKFREYDSHLIDFEESFLWQVQIKPSRGFKIISAPRIDSLTFLATLKVSWGDFSPLQVE